MMVSFTKVNKGKRKKSKEKGGEERRTKKEQNQEASDDSFRTSEQFSLAVYLCSNFLFVFFFFCISLPLHKNNKIKSPNQDKISSLFCPFSFDTPERPSQDFHANGACCATLNSICSNGTSFQFFNRQT